MTEDTTITELMKHDHDLCDELLRQAESFARVADLSGCKRIFMVFRSDTLRHFAAEEEVLFPAFESASGMRHGPTQMMRMEHQQMRELLEDLDEALEEGQLEGWSDMLQALDILMRQHNLKEENILYPMCDRALVAPTGLIENLQDALAAGMQHA